MKKSHTRRYLKYFHPQFVACLKGGKSSRPQRARQHLTLELLEDRTVPAAVAPPSWLVSWWTGDNTANDLTGLNNAILSNGTAYAAGMVGQAFSYDGVNDRASLGDPDSLKFTASMSIEGWIQLNAVTTTTNGNTILFRGDSRPGVDPYYLSVNPNGTLQFGIHSGTQGMSIATPMPIPLSQLIHVAATLDDVTGAMKLYVNGEVVSQTVTNVRPYRDLDPTQNPGIGIGSANSTYNVPFNGLIDELAVYNRALTKAEIRGIHAAGSDGKIKTSTYIAADFPSVVEGTSTVTFTLTRVGSTNGQVVIDWATADALATAGADYVAASGQVVFEDSETVKSVTVDLLGDATPEAAESFWLTLSTPTSGWAAGSGLATITDDDVGVSIGDATALDGAPVFGSRGALVDQSANGGLNRSMGMAWGPDGNLYVSSFNSDSVLRYDGTTGEFRGTFIGPGSGLDSPADQGLHFRPDGKLYVLSHDLAEVRRYDATTGAFLDVFISAGSGGLLAAKGMTFGPDGNWYISSDDDRILRYAGTTGAFLGEFVSTGSGGLNNPRGLEFGPDGHLYVASNDTNTVLKYHGTTGAFLNTFVAASSGGLLNPAGLLFSNGNLFVASQTTHEVLRYDAATGAFLGVAVTAGLDGLDRPIGLLFDPNGNLLVGGFAEINRYAPGGTAVFTVQLNIPSATPVTVNYATANGTATAGSDYTAASGTVTFAPGQTVQTVVVPILDDMTVELNETFTVTLSSPVGATITDGTGIGTIQDYVPTKFYVVDGTANRTYEYGSTGTHVENYGLNSGNIDPRGAASTASGDKVWVVDSGRSIYVYNTAGVRLGSWWAQALNLKTQVEGIATNGTDIWLLDTKTDKVYKFTGAASLLAGGQSWNSSFMLNSGNRNPKDIVTDGTSIWVVEDSSTDKVFKYSMTGTFQGSWTLTGGGGSPTGITLDPSNTSQHLWVVDNATDRVYQYDNARSRTSGSQSASSSFALAAGNTNPQGIADPPVSTTGTLIASAPLTKIDRIITGPVKQTTLIDRLFARNASSLFQSLGSAVTDGLLSSLTARGTAQQQGSIPLTSRGTTERKSEGFLQAARYTCHTVYLPIAGVSQLTSMSRSVTTTDLYFLSPHRTLSELFNGRLR